MFIEHTECSPRPRLTASQHTMFFLLLLSCVFPRDVTQARERIAEYLPGSDVTQHNRIDLDQRDFQDFLANRDFEKAKRIYTEGGNSMKTSELTLDTALAQDYSKGTQVSQMFANATTTLGKLNARARTGDVILKVGITSPCSGEAAQFTDTSGCFREGIQVWIQGEAVAGLVALQLRWRTLAGFSTEAEGKMSGQPMFELFMAYYGLPDYADEFVRAALLGTDGGKLSTISFNFHDKAEMFRVECAQKGSAYWSVWMYVIREMEDAVTDCTSGCQTCNEAPVHAWDEAWAFYTGSLEGSKGSTEGRMLYRLAEKRCANFGTCKDNLSLVNKEILSLFVIGKKALKDGRCAEVRPMIVKIVNLMTVPLIQGTLRYAYKTDGQGGQKDKEQAEGVAFLGALLPRLNNCSRDDAETVKSLMWIGGSMQNGSFSLVKETLERNYACLGVTCNQVGALTDLAGEPCSEGGLSAGAVVGIVILILIIIVLAAGAVFWMKRRHHSGSKFSLFNS